MTAPSAHPTGTVTFLFSDIEGSTQRWENHPQAMAAALRRHDSLVRAAIESNDGQVFKTMGDAFCAVFWRAPDAVSAAVDALRALAGEDWTEIGGLYIRIALHSGATDERDGDYFGPAVNRVARLLGVAHGAQVVVSGTTASLLRGALPERLALQDLGEHRLKDLVESEHVWQLTAPGLQENFPPLRSLESSPNNLPRQRTPLVGRDDVLAEVAPLVLDSPLVSLVGTGGVGKTRVALQIGADVLDRSSDGVWLVELAAIGDPASVVDTLASTFGLRAQGTRPVLDVLLQYLRPRNLLLILDNCEHLIEEVARVSDAILRVAPRVHVLATSREPLRIEGERVYRMPSLSVPSNQERLTAETANEYGAIALFAQRAAASDSRFVLTDETVPIVAEICRRLDGIAFAIELAAARVKVLPLLQLSQKLDERFRVLTGGNRTALPRQQTMHALIHWSYDLLSEQERLMFRRMSVFAAGCTLEAAEAVAADQTLDAVDIFDLLSSLAEKSLVVAEIHEETTRYRLLESTRAFALELVSSETRAALERRHALWFAEFADAADQASLTQPTALWLAEFAPDFENARSAVEWSLDHNEVALATRLVVGFSKLYRHLGLDAELRGRLELLSRVLDEGSYPVLVARARTTQAQVTFGARSLEVAERAVELSERSNDPGAKATSLSLLADCLRLAGRLDDAQSANERALALTQGMGQTGSLQRAVSLNIAGVIANMRGQLDDARRCYSEALEIAIAAGHELMTPTIRLNMAEVEFSSGNTQRALDLVSAIIADSRGQLSSFNLIPTSAWCNSAAYKIVLGNIDEAGDAAREAVRLARGASWFLTAGAIQHIATVEAHSGDVRRGALLRGYVDAAFRGGGYEREPTEARTYSVLIEALRARLTEPEIEALATRGASLSEDQAVTEAFASVIASR